MRMRLPGIALMLAMPWVASAHTVALPDETSAQEAVTAAPLVGVDVATPAAPGSLAPYIASGADGRVVMSWLEPTEHGYALRFSSWADSGWSSPRTVAQGNNWFVNWADFPSVVPITADFWVAHWLVRRPAGGYAYDILVSVSKDGGGSWGTPFHPHRDDTDTEHGFVSIYPRDSGAGLVWLDGRNTAAGGGGMSLRSASLGFDGALHDEQEIDALTCDCCQTDAVSTRDGIIVAYRDRTLQEIRDIYVSRRDGSTWTTGIPVANDDWEIGGCPVNGPSLATDGNATVIAWFTAANDKPRVRLSRSIDGGTTFSSPVNVVDGGTMGRVGVVLLRDGSAIVSAITGSAKDSAQLTLVRVAADGATDAPFSMANDVVPFSVPQIIVRGDTLLAAWTVRENNKTAIRSATTRLTLHAAEGVESAGSF
ncbi:MAG: sialidase family protein [Woeseia sp.]